MPAYLNANSSASSRSAPRCDKIILAWQVPYQSGLIEDCQFSFTQIRSPTSNTATISGVNPLFSPSVMVTVKVVCNTAEERMKPRYFNQQEFPCPSSFVPNVSSSLTTCARLWSGLQT